MPDINVIVFQKNKELEPVSRSEYLMDKVQLEYFPYNDVDPVNSQADAISIYTTTGSGGMDTSATDGLRQGSEIRTNKHLFKSNQPKMWSGNFKHATRITTFGQFRSWSEYQNDISYYDNVIEFDPVLYITSQKNGFDSYPYPIYFNNGPQQAEEAVIEPLTKPFRLIQSVAEGAYPIHRPKGNLEDGNPDLNLPQGNSRILQLIPYASQLISDPFLDLGQRYFGAGSIEDMIVVEGYVDFIRTIIEPFNDLDDEKVVDQLALADTSQNALFISVLKKLDINLDEDLRQTYTQKSATAGYTIYGPNQARYGTDSVAYVGWSRGS
jgi:hypothetical protein